MTEFLNSRIVPVGTLDDPKLAVPLAEALLAGGIQTFEITLRNEHTLPSIAAIAAEVPEMQIGVGTVLTPVQLTQARDAGAQFGVAPGTNPRVIRAATELSLPFIPGVATATDVEIALELGCKLLKFFPATHLGGPAALKSLAAPYLHTGVRFLPLGGVRLDAAADWLGLEAVGAIGGSWLVARDLVNAENWDAITELARAAVELEEELA